MQQQSRRPSVTFPEATGTGLCGNDSSINLQHEMEQFAQEMAEASMSGNVYTVSDLRKTRFANAKLVVAPPFLNSTRQRSFIYKHQRIAPSARWYLLVALLSWT